MRYLVQVLEGRPADKMLRAAQFCLALGEHQVTHVWFTQRLAQAPWRHLLSDDEQQRLRALDVPWRGAATSFDELQQSALGNAAQLDAANRRLAATRLQHLIVEPGCHPPRFAPRHAWLALLGATAPPTDACLMAYERLYVMGDAAGQLPYAVAVQTFDAAAATPCRDGLVIAAAQLQQTAQMVAWLREAGLLSLAIFDPLFCRADYLAAGYDVAAALPLWGADEASRRAAAFATCRCVVVAGATSRPDDQFLLEADSCGATPLGHLIEVTQWSAEAVGRAVAAWRRGETAAPRPPCLDAARLGAALRDLFAAPQLAPPGAPSSHQVDGHRVRLFGDAAGFLAAAAPTGGPPALILIPGKQASVADVAPLLARYHTLYVDVADNPQFIVEAAAHARGARIELCDLDAALRRCLLRRDASGIDVLALHCSVAMQQRIVRRLTAPPGEPAGGSGSLPKVLLFASKRPHGGSADGRRGVDVAVQDFARSLADAASGRAALTWLGRRPPQDEHARFYFYPFVTPLGIDHDEADYGGLPERFAADAIDALWCFDPFISGPQGARALWAKRCIPVLSMLHSIHSVAGSHDVLLQALGSPSLPCDVVIAPSQCGKVAYQGLLAAAATHLRERGVAGADFAGSIEVIPYGIDVDAFAGMQRASCRALMDVEQGDCVIVALGRLAPAEKADLLPLLLAFRQLLRTQPAARLVLVGGLTGPDYANFLRQAAAELHCADRLTLHANVDAEAKALLLGCADVAVALSDALQETHGLGVLECMAAGLPVVAAAWNGYAEIVEDGHSGILLPTQQAALPDHLPFLAHLAEGSAAYGQRDRNQSVVVSPTELHAALQALCANPARRQAMGEAGRARCRSHFDVSTQARRMVDLLQQRLAMARHLEWPTAAHRRPFVDPLSQRFAHYSSHGLVDPAMPLALHPWVRDDPGLRQALLQALQLPHHGEAELLEAMLQHVARHGGTIEALGRALGTPRYPAEAIYRRAARALKYGLLAPG